MSSNNIEDVPLMEDAPTLKAEDFHKEMIPEAGDVDDNGSKASSATSDEFVKVSGKDSEEEPLPVTEEAAADHKPIVKTEPESFLEDNFEEEKEPQNLLSFVDPRDGFPSPGYSVQFNKADGGGSATAADVEPRAPEAMAFEQFNQNPQSEERSNVSEIIQDPYLVEPNLATPPVHSNDDYLTEPLAAVENDDIVAYSEDLSNFNQDSIDLIANRDIMANKKSTNDTQPKGFDPVQLETEPKIPIMSEVEQKPNDIMVFDEEEDDLVKFPPQTIIHNAETQDDPTPPEPVVEPEPPSEEEDIVPTVPDVVEDIAPPKPDVAPLISIEETKEDIKTTPPPTVEDIIEKPTTVDINEQDSETKDECKDPVIDLLHWRDVKQSACVLSFLLLVLGSLTFLSIISVFSYTGLALLTVTLSFRFYKLVLQTLNGTQQPHPFQHLLDYDLTISSEQVHKYADTLFKYVNCTIQSARSLFLIENTVNSLKLGVCLWLLTFIGCCFNGLTLVIAVFLFAFTAPPVYEKYQVQIDQYVALVNEKIAGVWDKITAKIPALKPKAKTE